MKVKGGKRDFGNGYKIVLDILDGRRPCIHVASLVL